jgi:hypothetical protein
MFHFDKVWKFNSFVNTNKDIFRKKKADPLNLIGEIIEISAEYGDPKETEHLKEFGASN